MATPAPPTTDFCPKLRGRAAENLNGLDRWDAATGMVWFVGIAGSSVAFGLTLIWLRSRRALGWLMLTVGPLLAIAGIVLPVVTYFGYVLVGIVLALSPPRTQNGHAAPGLSPSHREV